MEQHVILEITDGIATITLNRPDKRNALSQEMKDGLVSALDQITVNTEVRCAVLRGAGTAFCAGGDISSMGAHTVDAGRRRLKYVHRIMSTLYNLEVPVIASVQGPATGAGFSLALACDQIVASESAKFGAVFKKVGLAPDAGGVLFLVQALGAARAKELIFSARIFKAQEGKEMGLINKVVADDQLEQETAILAREYADSATLALAAAKKMIQIAGAPGLEAFLEYESQAQNLLLRTEDHLEGKNAFLEKRKAVFKGC